MKRFLKVCICLLMVVGVVGCGGSDSTEKQEAVVKHFFEYFKEAAMDKLTTICTKDNQDLKDITSMISGLDAYRDPKKFGQVFVDETDSFMKEVFSTLFVSYEIKKAEKKDDNYTITVDATMKDYKGFNFSTSEMSTIAEKYQKEHLSELQELYKSKGQQAMIEKIYADIAPQLYASMKEQIKTIKESKEKMLFTVVADGDNWLISKIQVYQ